MMHVIEDETRAVQLVAVLSSTAATLSKLAPPLDEFHAEKRLGVLSVVSNGANVLASRADVARSAVVAASRMRQALTLFEDQAHAVIEEAEKHRAQVGIDLFGDEETTTGE
jgi:hypothetical protein